MSTVIVEMSQFSLLKLLAMLRLWNEMSLSTTMCNRKGDLPEQLVQLHIPPHKIQKLRNPTIKMGLNCLQLKINVLHSI